MASIEREVICLSPHLRDRDEIIYGIFKLECPIRYVLESYFKMTAIVPSSGGDPRGDHVSLVGRMNDENAHTSSTAIIGCDDWPNAGS